MANVIVNGARAIFTNLISAIGGTAPNYMGLGSGTTAAAVTDTTLTTEYTSGTFTGYARVHVTPTRTTTTLTNDTIQWIASWTMPTGGATPAECGNFDASTLGTMLDHCVFSALPLSTNDVLQITKTLQFT